MADAEIVTLAREYEAQMERAVAEPWGAEQWAAAAERLLQLVAVETSPYRLGEVLRCDGLLSLPVGVVKATYERLFELGVRDVGTRLCYANYLLLHGPDWDDEANQIRRELEPIARAAGLWDSPVLGHHPVFFAGPE